MSLTLKEAAEQVFELEAFDRFMKRKAEQQGHKRIPEIDEWAAPEVETRTDEEARQLADTPHLTGDPEWDAIELEQTDPTRPLLSERFGG